MNNETDRLIDIMKFYLSDLPTHHGGENPAGHLQTPGEEHVPPFRQLSDPEHIATSKDFMENMLCEKKHAH